ncbi:MAG: hypothetical protein BZ138_06055 [Methanosphaera sp. rholeuAM270]|nr:MAG: hypothetical protein BZ138_06055 [Methanosphaera sp. rholeuAM270]
MDNKKTFLISIILLIIAVSVIVMLTNSEKYERIEITPNGTSIEVPFNQSKYRGEIVNVKIWNWDKGLLLAYNSNENNDVLQLGKFSFNAMNELIESGDRQNIDGFTCYQINADELLEIHLFDIIKVNYDGDFYCICLNNETTSDSIIICSNDKDVALHMAKSVQFRNVYPNNTPSNDSGSTIEEITEDLLSESPISDNVTSLLSKT